MIYDAAMNERQRVNPRLGAGERVAEQRGATA
jgi:hypothetical protein